MKNIKDDKSNKNQNNIKAAKVRYIFAGIFLKKTEKVAIKGCHPNKLTLKTETVQFLFISVDKISFFDLSFFFNFETKLLVNNMMDRQ